MLFNTGKREMEFREQLMALLNSFSIDNATSTPDFILADKVIEDLKSQQEFVQRREKWFGRRTDMAELLTLGKETPNDVKQRTVAEDQN